MRRASREEWSTFDLRWVVLNARKHVVAGQKERTQRVSKHRRPDSDASFSRRCGPR
jgi:hypothetical protein